MNTNTPTKTYALSRILQTLMILLIMGLLLLYAPSAISSARTNLLIWWQNVLPSLFPFFVLSSLLSQTGVLDQISQLFNPLIRILKMPGQALPVILLGAVSGFPVGAKLTGALLEQNQLSHSQAERLLLLSNLPGPMFVMGTVASSLLEVPQLGVVILCSQYISALSCSLLWSLFSPPEQYPAVKKPPKHDNFNLADTLTQSVSDGMLSMLRVAGFMCLCGALSAIAQEIGLVSWIIHIMHIILPNFPSKLVHAVFEGLLEMSAGCNQVSLLDLPLSISASLCSFILGFSGLSVLLQTRSFAHIQIGVLACSNFLRGLLAGIITYIWTNQLKLTIPVFSPSVIHAPQLWWISVTICGVLWLSMVAFMWASRYLKKSQHIR